jgi:hypothetical protein
MLGMHFSQQCDLNSIGTKFKFSTISARVLNLVPFLNLALTWYSSTGGSL